MADNSGIKYYLQKLKSFFYSKDILSFLLFFALSSGFWFINVLGKERETNISIPIRYVGLPQNIIISNNPPTKIIVSVKDQGLQLLNYSKFRIKPLVIDISRIFYQKGEILFTSDQLRERLSRYLVTTTSILEIHPDSIRIQYEKLSTVTLPIKLVSKIELAHQYIISEQIRLEPSTVTIHGPKKILDSLKTIPTELVVLKNISDTNNIICKLKPIKSVRYSSKEIKVSIFVEQFTEKKVQIPIVAINCPKHLSIRTFPTMVEATYIVGLSHFNSFNPDYIQVFMDYNEMKNSNTSKHKLTIKNNSPYYISNLRISPQEVEFLLEQN